MERIKLHPYADVTLNLYRGLDHSDWRLVYIINI